MELYTNKTKRPDMKTLTFAVDVLILEKCGKEIEEKQDHWFHILKEYGLQMNLDKTMTENFKEL
jgi:DNA replication protein DnaC